MLTHPHPGTLRRIVTLKVAEAGLKWSPAIGITVKLRQHLLI